VASTAPGYSLAATLGFVTGIEFMVLQRIFAPNPFFRRKAELAKPGILEEEPEPEAAPA
jgi:hypothetical protein